MQGLATGAKHRGHWRRWLDGRRLSDERRQGERRRAALRVSGKPSAAALPFAVAAMKWAAQALRENADPLLLGSGRSGRICLVRLTGFFIVRFVLFCLRTLVLFV